jgi:quinoprotein glucose dehydrogenase
MLRELKNIILLRDWRKPTGRAEWSVGILGGVIALIGISLALGGAELIAAGGSWYYLFDGLALIVAGRRAQTARRLDLSRSWGPRSGLWEY